MVLNSHLVVMVANVSANICQYIACNPERLSSEQVLHLLFCFPFQQFRHFALCLSTFFCFPRHRNPFLSSSSDDDSSSSSSSSPSDSDLDDSQHYD